MPFQLRSPRILCVIHVKSVSTSSCVRGCASVMSVFDLFGLTAQVIHQITSFDVSKSIRLVSHLFFERVTFR